MTTLVIVRHGQAEAQAFDDAARELTDAGCAQVQATADWLRTQQFTPDLLFSSPLRRALGTAQILRRALAPACELGIDALLIPEARVLHTTMWLEALQGRILVASHMPLVAALTRELCGALPAGFQTGTAVMLKRHDHGWHVLGSFTPPV